MENQWHSSHVWFICILSQFTLQEPYEGFYLLTGDNENKAQKD
jgi:hypothetical protein